MPRLFLRLFILLFTSLGTAQKIPRTENICFFQDAKTGKPITIVNDYLVYKGELKNPIILKHNNYPDALERYKYHFNIKNHTYLVHVGCGPVLEYRNDSIVRIDNSFLQKNQYGASPFVYKNQICLFGGSGLFSDKNFITKFDLKSNEWFQFFVKGDEKPSPRSVNIDFFNKNGLYILGGWTNVPNTNFEKDQCLWFFNFNTFQWNRKGNYNKNLLKFISEPPERYYTFKTEKKLYVINGEVILEIDFEDNKLNYFENKNIILCQKPYFDTNSNSLVYLQYLSGAENLELSSISLSQLLKYPLKNEKLYYSSWIEYSLWLMYLVLGLILTIRAYKFIVNKKKYAFVYHRSKNYFYYNSKIISNLDPLEEKILVYLFENQNTFIQLNQLNRFFEKRNPDNVANMIKKRDLVFASLFVKLNAYVMHGENPLVLIKKNEVDKRIKEIRLNPLYFTLK
jgi:hypothetical protein